MDTQTILNGKLVTLDSKRIYIDDELVGDIDYTVKDNMPTIRVHVGTLTEFINIHEEELINKIVDTALSLQERLTNNN